MNPTTNPISSLASRPSVLEVLAFNTKSPPPVSDDSSNAIRITSTLPNERFASAFFESADELKATCPAFLPLSLSSPRRLSHLSLYPLRPKLRPPVLSLVAAFLPHPELLFRLDWLFPGLPCRSFMVSCHAPGRSRKLVYKARRFSGLLSRSQTRRPPRT